MKEKDLLLRLTFCLAVGGLGTVAVMCLFVGFGFSTVIGKEAVYLCLVLQAVHVAVMHSRENRLLRSSQAPLPSKKMRCIRAFAAWLWRLGALTLVASLFLILIGMLMSSLWVVLTCWIGFFCNARRLASPSDDLPPAVPVLHCSGDGKGTGKAEKSILTRTTDEKDPLSSVAQRRPALYVFAIHTNT